MISKWILALTIGFVAIAFAVGTATAEKYVCYEVTQGVPGCIFTCLPTAKCNTGNCVGGSCDVGEMTVCYLRDEAEIAEIGDFIASDNRPCGGVYYCTFDPPCTGQSCKKGMLKVPVSGDFDTIKKNGKCPPPGDPEPPGG